MSEKPLFVVVRESDGLLKIRRNRWDGGKPGGATGIATVVATTTTGPSWAGDYLNIHGGEADDLVEALAPWSAKHKEIFEHHAAQWIRDHIKYHPHADQVLLEALADGILQRLHEQASAKVEGHDYVFDMECGWCDRGQADYGSLGPHRSAVRTCVHCAGTGSVRVRRRHVPGHYGLHGLPR